MSDDAGVHTAVRCVNLDVFRISLRAYMSQDALAAVREADVKVYLDHDSQALVRELRASMVGKPSEVRDVASVTVPADWWQAFRARWLPAWWLRRWPVVTHTIVTRQEVTYRVCPHMGVPPGARHVQFLLVDDLARP